MRLACGFAALMLAVSLRTGPAQAFPPYRSTDAGTADPYSLEMRLGLGRVEVDNGETGYTAPLLRANLGLPGNLELISELEYEPSDNALGDGAAGFKWVPITGPIGLGAETLALLPVRHTHSGIGIESQLVATYRTDNLRVHVNAGGFSDPRGAQTETGWRASTLTEMVRPGYRVGFEIFAKKVTGKPTDARAGVGLIYDLKGFDIRTGVHVGLTRGAPDAVASLWIAKSFSLGSLFGR